jgi:hypothetical protein
MQSVYRVCCGRVNPVGIELGHNRGAKRQEPATEEKEESWREGVACEMY